MSIAAVVVVGMPFLLNLVSVQPGAAAVKALFESGDLVKVGVDYPAIAESVTVTDGLVVPTVDAPDAQLVVYQPMTPPAAASPVILWVHGGGFISGSATQVGRYATMLASEGYVVASLEYSLAPETRYPAPIRQGNAALAYVMEHAEEWAGDRSRIFLGGDSAGAQIASQLSALMTDTTLASDMGLEPAITPETLRGVILFCGLYDMSTVGSTGFPAIRTFLWSYTGERNWLDYNAIDQLSTTQHVTSAFPATFLAVGNADPFEPQAEELRGVLQAAGIPVTTQFWDDDAAQLGHEYQFNLTTDQARETYKNTLTFLSQRSK